MKNASLLFLAFMTSLTAFANEPIKGMKLFNELVQNRHSTYDDDLFYSKLNFLLESHAMDAEDFANAKAHQPRTNPQTDAEVRQTLSQFKGGLTHDMLVQLTRDFDFYVNNSRFTFVNGAYKESDSLASLLTHQLDVLENAVEEYKKSPFLKDTLRQNIYDSLLLLRNQFLRVLQSERLYQMEETSQKILMGVLRETGASHPANEVNIAAIEMQKALQKRNFPNEMVDMFKGRIVRKTPIRGVLPLGGSGPGGVAFSAAVTLLGGAVVTSMYVPDANAAVESTFHAQKLPSGAEIISSPKQARQPNWQRRATAK